MAQASEDTMMGGLKKLLTNVAQLSVLPDADLSFLTSLQQVITQYLRQAAKGVSMAGAAGGPGGGSPDGQSGGMGGAGMGGPLPPMPPNGMAPGGMSGGGMGGLTTPPNADELRRVLGATGVTQ